MEGAEGSFVDPKDYLSKQKYRRFEDERDVWVDKASDSVSQPKLSETMAHLRRCQGKIQSNQEDNGKRVLVEEATGIEEGEGLGYSIHKYLLQVSDTGCAVDDQIPVWLLVPKEVEKESAKRWPAVVVHHQHNDAFHLGLCEPVGLAGNPEQALARELVERGGHVVATFDALAFGARQEKGGERYTFTRHLLAGSTLNGKYCYDISAVIDFLCGLPYVDPNRIAMMGHSLGGQMSVYSGVVDARIKVVVSSCGFSTIKAIQAHHQNHNLALYLPGFLTNNNYDIEDVLGMWAPRPLVLYAGALDDIFPIEGVAEAFVWIKDLYKALKAEDNLEVMLAKTGHGLPVCAKKKIFEFLDKHL